jgi:hypothetical protein
MVISTNMIIHKKPIKARVQQIIGLISIGFINRFILQPWSNALYIYVSNAIHAYQLQTAPKNIFKLTSSFEDASESFFENWRLGLFAVASNGTLMSLEGGVTGSNLPPTFSTNVIQIVLI